MRIWDRARHLMKLSANKPRYERIRSRRRDRSAWRAEGRDCGRSRVGRHRRAPSSACHVACRSFRSRSTSVTRPWCEEWVEGSSHNPTTPWNKMAALINSLNDFIGALRYHRGCTYCPVHVLLNLKSHSSVEADEKFSFDWHQPWFNRTVTYPPLFRHGDAWKKNVKRHSHDPMTSWCDVELRDISVHITHDRGVVDGHHLPVVLLCKQPVVCEMIGWPVLLFFVSLTLQPDASHHDEPVKKRT